MEFRPGQTRENNTNCRFNKHLLTVAHYWILKSGIQINIAQNHILHKALMTSTADKHAKLLPFH